MHATQDIDHGAQASRACKNTITYKRRAPLNHSGYNAARDDLAREV